MMHCPGAHALGSSRSKRFRELPQNRHKVLFVDFLVRGNLMDVDETLTAEKGEQHEFHRWASLSWPLWPTVNRCSVHKVDPEGVWGIFIDFHKVATQFNFF